MAPLSVFGTQIKTGEQAFDVLDKGSSSGFDQNILPDISDK